MCEMRSQRDAFGQALLELGDANERVLVLDADLASSSKLDAFAAAHPERFFQMGISEQNMVGTAAGLATWGFVPFVNTFAAFASKRMTDQLRVCCAQPGLPVKVIAAYSGLLSGKTGKTHQSVQDIAILRTMPNMTVVAPADAVEAAKLVAAAAAYPGPVYCRLTRDPAPLIFCADYDFRIGKAVVIHEGRDITIITTGQMAARAMQAAKALGAEGISAHILHVATLKPLDEESIVAAAQKTGLVVTAEEHTILGGLGGAVAETLAEHAPTPVRRVGVDDTYSESAPNDDLLEKYGLTAAHIARAAQELCESREPSRR